ncbi:MULTISPECIES: PucR family transcriptional regulator ligand-binding domain-containing protein [unclassified Mycolicibacterium]|uniref:PucR family transcriptional regulator n=1 Tax=unclassified Mycolicibacterium TaxID=2636767 RepID=UPI001F4C12D4|nr:PucR family transcriptional regulator ligand-binding domain-containing protein [Mycolicibacterium sp. YH-1]UNB52453.1 PucR family transcriptional regulator ligand-binding domain-containing protein [Mycolicibacterium sp. YH-1]
MAITVRSVLSMPLIASADPEVLSGHHRLDHAVRWVHPAEVADIAHLLSGGELVLVTGIVLPENTEAMQDYAQSLSAAGVAGLFIELGRRWSEVPPSLVMACRSVDLVLVALHKIVRFAGVVEEVGGQILASQVEDLRASEHIHETFTRLDLNAAGPDEILTAVVQIAHLPVVLESSRHHVIRYNLAGRDPKDVLSDWPRRSRGVSFSTRTGYDRASGRLTTVVGSLGDDWGRLSILTDSQPSRRDHVLVERAAAAMSLYQMRSRARDSVERNTHTALIGEMRAGRMSPELTMRCETANFPARSRRFVAIGVRQRVAEGRQWALTDIASNIAQTARSLGVSILVGVETDHVIALIGFPQSIAPEVVMTRLTQELQKSLSAHIARGEVVERLDEAYQTLIDARNILAVTDPDDERPWVTLADVHLKGLIHLLRDDERLRLFACRELAPLLAHDAQRGTALLPILRGFLDTPGPKAAAAKRLLLSRPVLYERLARIESILGVDLDDPHMRTSLHVAVMAKELFDGEASGRRQTTQGRTSGELSESGVSSDSLSILK